MSPSLLHTSTIGTEEEFPLAVNDRVEEGFSVLGAFGRGLAVVILGIGVSVG